MDICPKVNVIEWLEFEFAYYDSAVFRFNHCIKKTPPPEKGMDISFFLPDFGNKTGYVL